MMSKKIKKVLASIVVLTGSLFAINGASSALATEYLATPQDLPAELTASGTQIDGDTLTYKSGVTKYDIQYAAKMDISSIWDYYEYYVLFDPSTGKAASNGTVIKGGFTITFTSADVLAIKDGVDLKAMIEANVSTDKDNGVYGSTSKFYDYFVVESVTKNGSSLVIKMNVKDGVDGTYLANKKSEFPQEILIKTLDDYTSITSKELTNGQTIVSSGTYEGKIILDTPDNYSAALQSAINRARSHPIFAFFAGLYFPTDAPNPVTSLAIPVSSLAEHILNVVKNVKTYPVTYVYESATAEKTLPADLVAPKEEVYEEGENVTLPTVTTPVATADGLGQWVFKGWDPAAVTNIQSATIVTGKWVYESLKYTVKYKFVPATGSPALPTEITKLTPEETEYEAGTNVTLPTVKSPVKVANGTWTFKGWDKEVKNIQGDVEVVGTWEFKEDSKTPQNPTKDGEGKSGKGTKKLAAAGQTTTSATALGLVALGLVAFLARKKQK